MASLNPSRALGRLIALLLSLVILIQANPLIARAEENRFGVQRDTGEGGKDLAYAHSSAHVKRVTDTTNDNNVINLHDRDRFPDGMLVEAAKIAMLDMKAVLIRDNKAGSPTTKKGKESYPLIPGAMSALEVNGELYFSSSIKAIWIKGQTNTQISFRAQFESSCVSRHLEKCAMINSEISGLPEDENRHKTDGKCGEQGAVHIFCKNHPDESGAEMPLPPGSRVATVGWVDKNTKDAVKLYPPCSRGAKDPVSTYGCDLFVQEFGLTAIVDENISFLPIPDSWRFEHEPSCL